MPERLTISVALDKKSSDIHIEPDGTQYRVRLRVHGALTQAKAAPPTIAKRLVSRLKIIAGLDITEQRLPQDGRIRVRYQEKEISIRVSICCTIHGEKIVLRLLNKEAMRLDQLEMSVDQIHELKKTLQKQQGFVIVCGPTGSGKTMTLYAILQYLNQLQYNIITIEDPVEVYLPNINQVNVNHKLQFGFNQALRTFLRQDPDIIMIGEIRDADTAQTAIKAAQTGHLVLSTLHSNSAIKAITRLRNMGIANYDLADSINLIISQRLIRRLCDRCKVKTNEIYQAVGCEHCYDGYTGRFAVFENVEISEQLANAIADNQSSQRLSSYIDSSNLQQASMDAVHQGKTTLSEVEKFLDAKN